MGYYLRRDARARHYSQHDTGVPESRSFGQGIPIQETGQSHKLEQQNADYEMFIETDSMGGIMRIIRKL